MATHHVHGSSASLSESNSFKDGRASIDSDQSVGTSSPIIPNGTNGHTSASDEDDSILDPIAKLQRELDRTREEKDTLAAQYRNLLAKLTTMRTTLGNKLKQDAEELDRQEQLVQQLTAQNEDLNSTVETLKEELVASHQESERASRELDAIRSRVLEESAQEGLLRERELRETQTELERSLIEREEWERTALQERAFADDLRSAVETFKRELELERDARQVEQAQLQTEREKAANLQSVLQDFQAAKDHELRQAIKERDSRLTELTHLLAEFKHRALTAEQELDESHAIVSRTQELEKEVKEKNLLIGKLRHEAVIINEHLMEALRRLRRSASDTNVDRRLVTNVLLSFLSTPRADPKRFEMLSLLASILSWSDPEREKAGLQRSSSAPLAPGAGGGGLPVTSSSFWSKSNNNSQAMKSMDLEKTDETESFSRLWVEFLLTEAAAGQASSASTPPRNNTSLPGTPTGTSFLSPAGPTGVASPQKTRRLGSFTSVPSAMASSPNLMLSMPPSRKGKEKEVGS